MSEDIKCPNCGEPLSYDEVDIGVGIMRSPAWCNFCEYSEIVNLNEAFDKLWEDNDPKKEKT